MCHKSYRGEAREAGAGLAERINEVECGQVAVTAGSMPRRPAAATQAIGDSSSANSRVTNVCGQVAVTASSMPRRPVQRSKPQGQQHSSSTSTSPRYEYTAWAVVQQRSRPAAWCGNLCSNTGNQPQQLGVTVSNIQHGQVAVTASGMSRRPATAQQRNIPASAAA
jgi:hypothetical protein